EPFNTNNREVYCMKETTEKIAFDYDLLGPVQNQKKNAPRKYGNKNLVIKNTSQKVERPKDSRPTNNDLKGIDAKEDKYKKEINEASSELNVNPIALNVVNSYLGEPKNSDNNDDDETWYPCNEEIPEDWLDSSNCKKLTTTIVEVELEAMEKLDKVDNTIQKLANNNKISKKIECSNKAKKVQIGRNNYQPYRISDEQNKHQASTKVNKTSRTYYKKVSYQTSIEIVTYWKENKIAYLYKSNIINQVTRNDNNMTFFYQKSTKDG
ncbi:42819_t:CDS:2, partial [Gigaspora margarita]